MGECVEAMVTAEFLRAGFSVLRPAGNSSRYDLAVDTGKEILRIQVKSSHIKDGYIRFKLYSHPGGYPIHRYTREEIDLFAVYNFETNKIYILPVGCTLTRLRIEPTKNKQEVGVHWGHDYEFDKWFARFQKNKTNPG